MVLTQKSKTFGKVCKGSKAIPERHALRNMIMPRYAQHWHMVKSDDGAALQKIRDCVHTIQNKMQAFGLSEDEMLLKFNDDKDRLQEAIDKRQHRSPWAMLLLGQRHS